MKKIRLFQLILLSALTFTSYSSIAGQWGCKAKIYTNGLKWSYCYNHSCEGDNCPDFASTGTTSAVVLGAGCEASVLCDNGQSVYCTSSYACDAMSKPNTLPHVRCGGTTTYCHPSN